MKCRDVIFHLMSLLLCSSAFKTISQGHYSFTKTKATSLYMNSNSFLFEDDEFRQIAYNYLANKYKACSNDDCRFVCDRKEISSMLIELLPPVSKDELANEVEKTMLRFKSDLIEEAEFVDALMGNSYWAEAGELVVKELIFLDCLYNFYSEKRVLLSDSDYDNLKDQLAWEGSVAVSVTGDEAKFISAVAASRRGSSIMADKEYEMLKSKLAAAGSWVANRQQDPLEKMGVKTFMGYLHRELAGKGR